MGVVGSVRVSIESSSLGRALVPDAGAVSMFMVVQHKLTIYHAREPVSASAGACDRTESNQIKLFSTAARRCVYSLGVSNIGFQQQTNGHGPSSMKRRENKWRDRGG